MQVYLLTGLTVMAVVFLVMLSIQLFRIEKLISEVSDLVEHRVKKMYEKG